MHACTYDAAAAWLANENVWPEGHRRIRAIHWVQVSCSHNGVRQ
jgi:hypothetical protein